jgi:hypothetical protein
MGESEVFLVSKYFLTKGTLICMSAWREECCLRVTSDMQDVQLGMLRWALLGC